MFNRHNMFMDETSGAQENYKLFSGRVLRSLPMAFAQIGASIICIGLMVWLVISMVLKFYGVLGLVFVIPDSVVIFFFAYEKVLQILHQQKSFIRKGINWFELTIFFFSVVGLGLQIYLCFRNGKDEDEEDKISFDWFEIVVLVLQLLQTSARIFIFLKNTIHEYRRRRTIKEMPFNVPTQTTQRHQSFHQSIPQYSNQSQSQTQTSASYNSFYGSIDGFSNFGLYNKFGNSTMLTQKEEQSSDNSKNMQKSPQIAELINKKQISESVDTANLVQYERRYSNTNIKAPEDGIQTNNNNNITSQDQHSPSQLQQQQSPYQSQHVPDNNNNNTTGLFDSPVLLRKKYPSIQKKNWNKMPSDAEFGQETIDTLNQESLQPDKSEGNVEDKTSE
ncbi:MAG: hypothetical protein EZS28_018095 [Streblomastix strix]|uniref:Transmembrane protein n=1 Tax=Streblomastix strix TaxID=222440 RepID=A0A5J4VUR1_9EUKA|nr:MAG: hypothetical protein EZS28_018095 [Streblomastix strix]